MHRSFNDDYDFGYLPEPFDDDAYRTKEEVEKFIRDILQNGDYRLLHRAYFSWVAPLERTRLFRRARDITPGDLYALVYSKLIEKRGLARFDLANSERFPNWFQTRAYFALREYLRPPKEPERKLEIYARIIERRLRHAEEKRQKYADVALQNREPDPARDAFSELFRKNPVNAFIVASRCCSTLEYQEIGATLGLELSPVALGKRFRDALKQIASFLKRRGYKQDDAF
ncbi:MAG: hypothetical protein IJE77_03340 [Thermoguttaceae bacterium]|nr:hypothetical protein [Thermoguttaceae bacterium]MBQ9800676.1 hypothetical protein [Thermoguttaceae bacterium]